MRYVGKPRGGNHTSLAVGMKQWRTQHGAFIVETFFKNGESVVKKQRIFRKHFSISRHGKVSFLSTLHYI
jgi:hypothetical protein